MKSFKVLKSTEAANICEDSDFEDENDAQSCWNKPGQNRNILLKKGIGYQAETSPDIIEKCKSKGVKIKKTKTKFISKAMTETHIKLIKATLRKNES